MDAPTLYGRHEADQQFARIEAALACCTDPARRDWLQRMRRAWQDFEATGDLDALQAADAALQAELRDIR